MPNDDLEKLARKAVEEYFLPHAVSTKSLGSIILSALTEATAKDRKRIAELGSRLDLVITLGSGYDGLNAAKDLKTLIDDMVKAARGEMDSTDIDGNVVPSDKDRRIAELEALAISSSDEGTSFYYRDAWEADRRRIAELEDALSFYADENHYDENDAPGNWVNIGPDEVKWETDNGEIARRTAAEAMKEGESKPLFDSIEDFNEYCRTAGDVGDLSEEDDDGNR